MSCTHWVMSKAQEAEEVGMHESCRKGAGWGGVKRAGGRDFL